LSYLRLLEARSDASPFKADHSKRIGVQVMVYIVEQLPNTSFLIEFDILLLFHVWLWLLCIISLKFHSISTIHSLVQPVFIITLELAMALFKDFCFRLVIIQIVVPKKLHHLQSTQMRWSSSNLYLQTSCFQICLSTFFQCYRNVYVAAQ